MRTPPDGCAVLVVGAGPVGLLVAELLRRRGIDVIVAERAVAPPAEPRAAVLDDEALRALQVGGVAETVTRAGVVQTGAELELLDGRRVTLLHASPRTANGHPELLGLDQALLEAELGAALGPTVFRGWELVGLDGTTARLRSNSGEEHIVRADWVVGCDGAASRVRSLRGIAFGGTTFAQRWLVADAAAPPPGGAPVVRFRGDPGAPGVRLALTPSVRRAEVMVAPGTTTATPALVRRLVGEDAEPLRASVYTFHARTAERWRDGRVLLAGDAAHVMPPFAGQGLSAGLRDAVNLGWKLAAVVRGERPEAILDTYEAERRPHVVRMTALARFVGALVQPRRRRLALGRDLVLSALDGTPVAARLQNGAPKPGATLPPGPLVERTPGAGELLPQPLAGDDRLGDGFATVRRGDDPLTDAWLERHGVRAAVVRPDRHVLSTTST
jgi:3-(3-hydroxy-phenyl)propionate hydroxylase